MNSVCLRVISFLFLASALSANAAATWHEETRAAQDAANMKSKEGFAAQFFLTQDTRIYRDWNKTTLPKIVQIETAQRDQPILTVVILTGAGRDTSGKAKVTCNFTAYRPDGKVYGKSNAILCNGKVPAGILLGEQSMSLRIEPADPPGTYTVVARVHDQIKKVNLTLKARFQVPPR